MRFSVRSGAIFCTAAFFALSAFALEDIGALLSAGKYSDIIATVEKTPAAQRTVEQWTGLAFSYRKTGASPEKMMAALKEAQKINPSEPSVYLGMGYADADADRCQTAIENFQKSYLLSRSSDAAEGIAKCAAKMGQLDKARDAAESAVALNPDVFDSRLILTDIFLKKEDYKNAAAQLSVIVTKKPGTVEYWKQLALCEEKLGNKDKLAEADIKIVELDKKDIAARRRMVEYSTAKKDSSTAFAICKELALLTPNDPKVFKYLYQIAYVKGQKKDAILYLKNFLMLDSSSAAPYKMLGEMLYEQKDADGALDAYRHALRIDPAIKGFYKHYEELVLNRNLENEAIKVIQGAIAASEADSKSYIALGTIYKKQKLYPQAVKAFQEALKTESSNVEILADLAESQAAAGDAAGAVITYEQVVLMNPAASKEYKELGDLNTKLGKKDAAVNAYKKYLGKVPANAEVATLVGLYSFDKAQYADAIKFLDMVKDTAQQSIEYLAAMGDAHYNTGNFAPAAKFYARARAKTSSESTLRRILKPLAISLEKTGDEMRAAEAYEAYSKLPGVKDPDAAYKRAFLREKTARANAIKMYEANTVLFPADYRSFMRLGFIYAEDKATYAQAASMLNNTAKLVDSIPAVWQKLGDLYGKLGDEEKELAAYKKLIALDPQNLTANRRSGMILLKKKQLPQAISNLEMTLTMAPKEVDVMLLLANAYMETNRPKQAIDLLAKAKAIQSDNLDIRIQLYNLYKSTNQPKDAETEIKQLIDLKKDNKYRLMYVKDLFEQKRLDEARSVVKQVVATDFMNIEALMYMARIQTAQNQLDDAIETYKNVLYINEKFAPALCERGNIYMLRADTEMAKSYYQKALAADAKYAPAELGLSRVYKTLKNPSAAADHLAKAKLLDPKNPEIAAEK